MDKRVLEAEAGGDLVFTIIVQNKDKTLFPLAGYTAKIQIREKVGGTVFSELSSPASGISINTSTSTITVTVPAADTEKFKSTMLWDVMLTNGTSKFFPAGGTITVNRTVTT
jgi:hypothetical protein